MQKWGGEMRLKLLNSVDYSPLDSVLHLHKYSYEKTGNKEEIKFLDIHIETYEYG